MDFRRLLRHACATDRSQRRAFPPQVTQAIADALHEVEQRHDVEIRFVVEAALDWPSLIHRKTTRMRALEVFSLLRIWDTERNDGILVYVLLAERAVEVVVDRGIAARVPADTWTTLCRRLEASFARRDFEHGAMAAIRAIDRALQAFPTTACREPPKRPDQPLVQ